MAGSDASDSACMAVVTKIADEEDVDPLELEPLQSTLDTDALETLCSENADQDLRVEFRYHGYEITVTGDGQVAVS